jgi:integrase
MPRRPPRANTDQRGPRVTERLPDRSDARRTWTGPPVQRTPGRWSGAIDFAGHKHHVGTFDTPRQWGQARDRLIHRLREEGAAQRRKRSELDGITILGFVGEPGEGWPYEFRRNGKRSAPSTFEHHEQAIRAFLRQFGSRRLREGVSRLEATRWAADATENQITSVIALYNDARSIDETVINPFAGMSRCRTRGRADLPNVLSADEVHLLRDTAALLHPDGYGPVLEAMIEIMATSAPRPGELFAAEWTRLDLDVAELFIKYAVKKGGRLGPPKYRQERPIVLAPSAIDLIGRLPRLSERFLLPTKWGRLMTQPSWATYWHPLRDAFTARLPTDHWLVRRIADCASARASEPDPIRRMRLDDGRLDFYELRHRACTYMATPAPDGLGLSAPDIAYQVGHRDGGRLVERVYIHRDPVQTRDRIRAAMGHEC